jgi:hypothetical protein
MNIWYFHIYFNVLASDADPHVGYLDVKRARLTAWVKSTMSLTRLVPWPVLGRWKFIAATIHLLIVRLSCFYLAYTRLKSVIRLLL